MADPVGAEADAETTARQRWMGLLARASATELARRIAALEPLPPDEALRGPETGTVMVRGRTGGTGAAFNLGEMTVTRCSLRLPDGAVGHAMVQGRDRHHARRAALVDALMQGPRAAEAERAVIAPLAEAEAARRARRAAKAAGTRVQFFTLARGEVEP